MFLPISDDDRHLTKPAFVTLTFLFLNLGVFALQIYDPSFTYSYSAVPSEITTGEDLVAPVMLSIGGGKQVEIPHGPGPKPLLLTLFTSMFMHGSILHIAGNMLFLWIFGDNVEHRFGAKRFLLVYLLSGLAGGLAHIFLDPGSAIPMLGASGAISGVLGAYLVLFPRNKVKALLFVFWVVSVPAFLVIGLWIVTQFLGGIGSIAEGTEAGGVAYAAHIGGLLAGVVLALLYRVRMHGQEPESALLHAYQQDPKAKRIW